ncbi:MAG: zf-TFIIB domain-containing protein [Candidatus Thiodiazotropha lotti]|uniref:Zf-TFIIB domain-containing protein n=1 Tax=Candidatus Thiodiazotropha lotti TaxID=2792787 RepID=A0A9E4K822_9GAMM|nr:zf-TFIIB domain-containing protein [Candidatus Thiodiazotropha lotti]
MEETTSKGIITHTCFYCNGTWINSDSLKIILENENNTLLQIDLKNSFESLKVTNKDRHCPECKNQQLFQIIVRGVELDLCPECIGVFFDEGELKQLLPSLENKSKETGVGSYLAGEGLFWAIIAFLLGGS